MGQGSSMGLHSPGPGNIRASSFMSLQWMKRETASEMVFQSFLQVHREIEI